MTPRCSARFALPSLLVALMAVAPLPGQGGGAGRGMMADPSHAADMQMFQKLFDHRAEITRQIIKRKDGVETLTESVNPDVVKLLQTHVEAMLARVKEARPIHQRDPLFAELFRYADRIQAKAEPTARGVRVIETSRDAYAVKLLQAHAEVVSAFITNGRSEMLKNHPLPPR